MIISELIDNRKIYLSRPSTFRIREQVFGLFNQNTPTDLDNYKIGAGDLICFLDRQNVLPYSPNTIYHCKVLTTKLLFTPNPEKTNYLYQYSYNEICQGDVNRQNLNLFLKSELFILNPSEQVELFLLTTGAFLNCQEWRLAVMNYLTGEPLKAGYSLLAKSYYDMTIQPSDTPCQETIPVRSFVITNTNVTNPISIYLNYYARI